MLSFYTADMKEGYIQKEIAFQVEKSPEIRSFHLTTEPQNPYAGRRDIPMAEFTGDLLHTNPPPLLHGKDGRVENPEYQNLPAKERAERTERSLLKHPLTKMPSSGLLDLYVGHSDDVAIGDRKTPIDFEEKMTNRSIRSRILQEIDKREEEGVMSREEFLAAAAEKTQKVLADVDKNGASREAVGLLAIRMRDILEDYAESGDRREYNAYLHQDSKNPNIQKLNQTDTDERRNPHRRPRREDYDDPGWLDWRREMMYDGTPRNIEDFALAIQASDNKWIHEYPVIAINPDTGKAELNQANMLEWVRERMMFWHDDDPDGKHNFFQNVALGREYRDIALGFTLQNQAIFFQSADGIHRYNELADQMRREAWTFTMTRQFDIEYQSLMGDDSKLPDTVNSLYYLNTFTKPVWEGKSALYHMFMIPEEFTSKPMDLTNKETKEASEMEMRQYQDAKLGNAAVSSYLAYYHLADYDMLVELFGEDSSFFSEESVQDLRDQHDAATHIAGSPTEGDRTNMISPSDIQKVFALKGTPAFRDKFIEFVNFYNRPTADPRNVNLIRSMIRKAVGELHNIKNADRMKYAETIAFSMPRWTLAAGRNDTNAAAYDASTKWTYTVGYREKQYTTGNNKGNEYNLFQFKRTGIDFMNGVTTIADGKYMEDGELKSYNLRPLEVLWQIHREAQERKREGRSLDDEEERKKLRNVVGQLVFANNAMRAFAVDHIVRQSQVYSQIMGAGEVKFSDFTHESLLKGVIFDQDKFAEAVQKTLFTPIRYAYRTYNSIDYRQMMRVYGLDHEWEWESVAESFFGYQLLNTPKFRKLKPEYAHSHEHAGHGHEPHYHDGMFEKDKNGKFIIDVTKVQADKTQLMKQIIMMRIATEIYAHRDAKGRNPGYDPSYYRRIIEALERIPGVNPNLSEEKISGQEFGGRFFDHTDIEWLRSVAEIQEPKLIMMSAGEDLGKGVVSGIVNMASVMAKGMAA